MEINGLTTGLQSFKIDDFFSFFFEKKKSFVSYGRRHCVFFLHSVCFCAGSKGSRGEKGDLGRQGPIGLRGGIGLIGERGE